jgi:hypothetical protein
MQPTPLAASKIGAILRARICYKYIAFYWRGAADGQAVGWQSIIVNSWSYVLILVI